MSEQEKKTTKIDELLNAETNPKFLCPTYTKQKKKITQEKKNFLRKGGLKDWTKKQKEGFLTDLATALKKDAATLIRKQANGLKVHGKTVRTAIKQDFNQDFNPLIALYGAF